MDSEPRIIAISGISGVGKSTISSILMKYLPSNTILIRQDDYYLQDKPKYTLSNGVVVKNWDTIDAIDWTRLNSDLLSLRYKENIVFRRSGAQPPLTAGAPIRRSIASRARRPASGGRSTASRD